MARTVSSNRRMFLSRCEAIARARGPGPGVSGDGADEAAPAALRQNFVPMIRTVKDIGEPLYSISMCAPVAGMRERGSLFIARLDKGFVAHLLVPGKGGACVSDRCDASAHALRRPATHDGGEHAAARERVVAPHRRIKLGCDSNQRTSTPGGRSKRRCRAMR